MNLEFFPFLHLTLNSALTRWWLILTVFALAFDTFFFVIVLFICRYSLSSLVKQSITPPASPSDFPSTHLYNFIIYSYRHFYNCRICGLVNIWTNAINCTWQLTGEVKFLIKNENVRSHNPLVITHYRQFVIAFARVWFLINLNKYVTHRCDEPFNR